MSVVVDLEVSVSLWFGGGNVNRLTELGSFGRYQVPTVEHNSGHLIGWTCFSYFSDGPWTSADGGAYTHIHPLRHVELRRALGEARRKNTERSRPVLHIGSEVINTGDVVPNEIEILHREVRA